MPEQLDHRTYCYPRTYEKIHWNFSKQIKLNQALSLDEFWLETRSSLNWAEFKKEQRLLEFEKRWLQLFENRSNFRNLKNKSGFKNLKNKATLEK